MRVELRVAAAQYDPGRIGEVIVVERREGDQLGAHFSQQVQVVFIVEAECFVERDGDPDPAGVITARACDRGADRQARAVIAGPTGRPGL